MRKTTKRKPRLTYKRGIQRVQVWGGDVNNPSPLLPLRAPISGTIVEQNTTGGTGVRSLDNQPNLFTIADLSTVWVICDAYQDLLLRVHVGDVAEIYLSNYPNQKYLGTVINIIEVLDLRHGQPRSAANCRILTELSVRECSSPPPLARENRLIGS